MMEVTLLCCGFSGLSGLGSVSDWRGATGLNVSCGRIRRAKAPVLVCAPELPDWGSYVRSLINLVHYSDIGRQSL